MITFAQQIRDRLAYTHTHFKTIINYEQLPLAAHSHRRNENTLCKKKCLFAYMHREYNKMQSIIS